MDFSKKTSPANWPVLAHHSSTSGSVFSHFSKICPQHLLYSPPMKEKSAPNNSQRRLPALPLAGHKRRTSCNVASARAVSLGEPNDFAPIILPPTSSPIQPSAFSLQLCLSASPERGQPCPPPYDFVPHDSVIDSPRLALAAAAPSSGIAQSVGQATSVPPLYDFAPHHSVNSKWTQRIDFWSIFAHFEIGTHGRPFSSVLHIPFALAAPTGLGCTCFLSTTHGAY